MREIAQASSQKRKEKKKKLREDERRGEKRREGKREREIRPSKSAVVSIMKRNGTVSIQSKLS